MKLKSIAAFAVLCFLCLNSFSQNKCSCNFKENLNLLNLRDTTEVYEVTQKLKLLNNNLCLFKALELELKLFLNQKKEAKALQTIQELENFLRLKECKDQFTLDLYLSKVEFYKVFNNYEKLSEFAFKALKLAEELDDHNGQIEAIKSIVFLFTRMDEDDKNWNYIKRAQNLIFNSSDTIQSLKHFRWLAFEYETKYTRTGRKSLLDSLYNFATKSKIGAKKYNMFPELAMSYRALEAYSYHIGDATNALKYIDSAIYYGKKIKGIKNLSGLYISKSWDHLDLGEKDLAVKWMDTSFLYINSNDVAGVMMQYRDASDLYQQAGRADKALRSFKIYSKIKDSIINIQRTEIINELETKYKTELKDAKIKRQSVWLVITSLIIALILFIGTIIRLKRIKQKNEALKLAFKKQLTLEKELTTVRENIAQDFHDDLGNRLARISLLSNLVNKEFSAKEEKLRYKVKQITEDANDLYMGTRDFIFSLKENSDYIEELATYLSDFGENYFSKTNIKFVIHKTIESNNKLPYYWSRQLIYIFKEALTNTLKHAKCDEVILQFIFNKNQLTIICEDNGVGIKEESLNSSNGLLNMKERAQKIGGQLFVESKKEKGTLVRFVGCTK